MATKPFIDAQLRATFDGSSTLVHPQIGETYHSTFGAITESIHTYVNAGYNYLQNSNKATCMHIFEMGFGSGLNALLTLKEAQKERCHIEYHAVELYPLNLSTVNSLNYGKLAQMADNNIFNALHTSLWGAPVNVTENFTLYKDNCSLQSVKLTPNYYNLIYFDAFSPAVQSDLWSLEVFEKLFAAAQKGCVLVTYCSKGDVKRALRSAGFTVERLKGAPGKRHMLRATKPK